MEFLIYILCVVAVFLLINMFSSNPGPKMDAFIATKGLTPFTYAEFKSAGGADDKVTRIVLNHAVAQFLIAKINKIECPKCSHETELLNSALLQSSVTCPNCQNVSQLTPSVIKSTYVSLHAKKPGQKETVETAESVLEKLWFRSVPSAYGPPQYAKTHFDDTITVTFNLKDGSFSVKIDSETEPLSKELKTVSELKTFLTDLLN